MTNRLWNEELAPVERDGETSHSAGIWPLVAAMAVSLPVYLYAGGLSALGMSVSAVLLSALVGSLVAAAVAIGCGHAGARYGIPFAVLARTAFGVLGARVPVALRLVVGCAWVGIVSWLGAEAAWYALLLMGIPQWSWLLGACFAAFLILLAVPWRRPWGPVMGVFGGACLLLFLAVSFPLELMARGWKPFTPDPGFPVWPVFPPGHGIMIGVTALLGLWLPVVMSAADGARRVRSGRVPVWSVAAMPVATVLFSGGVAGTVRMLGGGPNFWSPLLLADGVTRLTLAVACLLMLAAVALLTAGALCEWLTGEIAITIHGRVSAAKAGWLVCLAAVLTAPWRWVASPERYIGQWLTGCAGLLAPIAVVVLVEYFALRRRWLNVDDLYQRDGLYEYNAGWNWKAFGACGAGWLVMAMVRFAPAFRALPESAVLMGAAITGVVYWVLRSGPPDVAQIPPTPLLIPLASFESEGASG